MKPSALQKMKEEFEAQEKQDFKVAMQNKIKDKISASSLPKFAKVNNKGVIDCQICHFNTKDTQTFLSHIKTKKHQSAVEQANRLQAQAKAKEEAAQYENKITKGQINAKRPAPYDIEMGVEDIKEEEETHKAEKNKNKAVGPSLVEYDEDDDEEEEKNVGLNFQKKADNEGIQQEGNEPIVEEPAIENNTGDAMIIEKYGLPQGFFDQKEKTIEEVRAEIDKAKILKMKNSYLQFMDEIKKTGVDDYEGILQEIQGEDEPVGEDEQEMLEKVIKGGEEEEEEVDAQDYISNLRKRLAGRMKIESQPAKQEETAKTVNKQNRRSTRMENEEEEDQGFSWRKRGLF